MNNISDVIIRGVYDDGTCKKKDLFFKQAEEYSPYIETAFSCLNQQEVLPGEIEVNVLWRFTHIFQELLHEKNMDTEEKQILCKYMIDTFLHLLSEIDLRHGLTKEEYYARLMLRELLGGNFGKLIADKVGQLQHSYQLAFSRVLVELYRVGSSIMTFCYAVKQIFPSCMIYQNKNDYREIFVYIGREEDKDGSICVELLIKTFLSGEINCRVFWKDHFGILGVDNTMIMDRIALV